MNDKTVSRGRPRKFDRDQVLDRAISTFWANGFEGASLDVLTESMGINRPSLYSTFGNKHSLFLEALDRYATTYGQQQIKPLFQESDIKAAVVGYFSEIARCVTLKNQPAGCLIACVAMETAQRDGEVRQKISSMFAMAEERIAGRLLSAQEQGQLSRQTDRHIHSRMIIAMAQSLASLARVGATRKELIILAKGYCQLLFPERVV